jgi:hypothetical protein
VGAPEQIAEGNHCDDGDTSRQVHCGSLERPSGSTVNPAKRPKRSIPCGPP